MLITNHCRFAQEVRHTVEKPAGLNGKQAIIEQSKKLGEMWRALPTEEKEVLLLLSAKHNS